MELVDSTAKEKQKKILPSWLYDFKVQSLIIAVLSLLLYGNSIKNEFAFDDKLVIVQNSYVLQGVSGIKDILTKDSYDSYYQLNHSANALPGGRYRPLSLVTFALEQEFFCAYSAEEAGIISSQVVNAKMDSAYEQQLLYNMHIRHLVNVLLFILCAISLLYFTRNIVLRNDPLTAFIAMLLFVVHPIHTEVVANVKSRDEILSLLFISLTFILAFKYKAHGKKVVLIAALISYFLAFMSKEYAISLIILLPLSFFLFNKETIMQSIRSTVPYMGIVVLYAVIRMCIINPFEVVTTSMISTDAYAYATGTQKIATEIAICFEYIKLLFFPYPLCSDYSYNAIPYKSLSDTLVWCAVGVYVLLIYGFFYFISRNKSVSFAIAFYLLNMFLVSNLVFNIGTTMNERLIFHASFGFTVIVSSGIAACLQQIKKPMIQRWVLGSFVSIITICCGYEVIARNAVWKNDATLSVYDVGTMPGSYLLNGNAANAYLNLSTVTTDELKVKLYMDTAIMLLNKAININPFYTDAYMHRAYANFVMHRYSSELPDIDKVKELNPAYNGLTEMYYNAGVGLYKNAQYESALLAWRKTLTTDTSYVKAKKAIDILYSTGLVSR